MSKLLQNSEYKQWIEELTKRYRTSQIKACVHVNKEEYKERLWCYFF